MSYRVLIVDDSPVMRSVIKRALTVSGIPVNELHQATNGREALALLGKTWVDLVFMDINMPEMTGVEVVEQMHRDDLLADVPVVIVSTERSDERIGHLKQLGVRAYLPKPFSPEQFRDTVTAVLPAARPTP